MLLWYLNIHASPPYRWQRCQALLYPHMLLLSWLAPGGGQGIVSLDLLNCAKALSAYSPLHPLACDDVGTLTVSQQTNDRDGQSLMDTLVPFQMLYADGVERLAAESLLERQKWVNRIMYVFYFILFYSCVLTNILLIWIGILFICQSLCQILLPWLAHPPALSALFFPLTAIAVSPAMDLAQQSSSHHSAPCLIYLISKAIAPLSLANHLSHPHTILKPWTIQLSKPRVCLLWWSTCDHSQPW